MPRAKTCQEVEEMEMPPLQELSLRFTGSHLANASGLGQMLGAKPMSQSLHSVQLWFSNLPCAAQPTSEGEFYLLGSRCSKFEPWTGC